MDLKPFKLDIDELINEFAENKLTTLVDMKGVWLSRKFSFIFEASPTKLADSYNALKGEQKQGNRRPKTEDGSTAVTISEDIALFSVEEEECLHMSNNDTDYGELKRLKNLLVDAKGNNIKVVSALVKRMLERNVFLFGFLDINEGSVTERINELTDIQNARIQVSHKKLFSNTQIEQFINMDLDASEVMDVQNIKHITETKRLIGDVVEKTVQDWNVQKELFCQQTGLDHRDDQGPQQPQDNENFGQRKDDVNFEQEGDEHFEQQDDDENFEPKDDEKFAEELEQWMLSVEEL
ncbi:unnamed protein product [Camellia sinensis]